MPNGPAAGGWVIFGDAQTGKLDVANGRTLGSISIVEKCEARDAETIKALTRRGLLSRLVGWL